MYKLIIIDDEEKIVEGIGNLFPWETIGFSVKALFTSATEALEYLDKYPVDVVMSDIEMPDMSGLELSQKLVEREGLKVVLFSSHRNYDYFRGAIHNKVADFLLKPIEYSVLLECFEKIKWELGGNNQKKMELPEGYYEKIIRSVKDYMCENFQNATLERAAEKVNMSPAYLSRLFKEKSGSGFSETLFNLRMDKACEMLKDIQYKSYDIAYYIGYDNPKNFSRAFKSHFGISPMQYRKMGMENKQ